MGCGTRPFKKPSLTKTLVFCFNVFLSLIFYQTMANFQQHDIFDDVTPA
jgi:hypothetical protein